MSYSASPTADEVLTFFPPGTRLDGDGTLKVGDCRLDDVAVRFGTPAIVVAEAALRQRGPGVPERIPQPVGREVAFASKSFLRTAVPTRDGG